MARGTAKVTEKITTPSPNSTSPIMKMRSKATKAIKTILTQEETNQLNPSSTLKTKESSSPPKIANTTMTTKTTIARVMPK